MNYDQSGVHIQEGYRAVARYRDLAAGTATDAVLNRIGSFAGLFSLKALLEAGAGMSDPVLVSGTDGVGTKLAIAFALKKYDTVGIDCVAMCVNDILCHGARPLFFLDYLACGALDADVAAALVSGVAAGCRESGCALIGGETAEMPGFYADGIYDIAGFACGLVDRARIIDGSAIRAGDALVGLASSGPHSNGFSLIRAVLPRLDEDFGGLPLGRALLEPTRLYPRPVLALASRLPIHGMAHITGGGFFENIPRMFFMRGGAPPLAANGAGISPVGANNYSPPPRPSAPFSAPPPSGGEAIVPIDPPRNAPPLFRAVIHGGSWALPPIFSRIAAGVAGLPLEGAAAQEAGARLLASDEALRRLMYNTFNMGIGLVLALAPADARAAIDYLDSQGFPAFEIGHVEEAARSPGTGEEGIRFE
ncbi:MAG: phosphoribosylformylglycinamidine cyclo-ligase [Treponema sp.]|jgi:phosphoribosylformylglycinamidine cyclo-ligase|nr:phosphoribosylformylglycinamidine cyclo-ligase [Treponema sp.]